MAILGTLILAIGWLALNTGVSLATSDGRIGVIAVNTVLAGAAGRWGRAFICGRSTESPIHR